MPNVPQIIPDAIVRWALDDKYPYHWGALMTVAVVTARLRQCERGERAQWVDLLNELREGYPHAHAVLAKRFSKTSSKAWEIIPADTDDPNDEATAEVIARTVEARIKRIPRWKQHVHGMCWAGFTGASGREIMWRVDADGYHVERLALIHSRRIGFGDEFKPYILNGGTGQMSAQLDPNDYPGKFILHVPMMADEHPTRTGLGRVMAYWMAFQRMINRSWVGYTERFGNPFPIATWKTNREDQVPTQAEIDSAKQLVRDVGRGSQPGWAGPDSIQFQLAGAATSSSGGSGENTVHKAQLAFINAEMSKVVEGGDLNTQSQGSGSRALGDSQSEDAAPLSIDDAGQLDETITHDLVWWLVALNFGVDKAQRFCPKYHTIVDDDDDSKAAAEVIKTAVDLKIKVPAAWAYAKLSIPQPQPGEAVLGEEDSAAEETNNDTGADAEPTE